MAITDATPITMPSVVEEAPERVRANRLERRARAFSRRQPYGKRAPRRAAAARRGSVHGRPVLA